MKLIENVTDDNWTCPNFSQLEVLDRGDKHYEWENQYYYCYYSKKQNNGNSVPFESNENRISYYRKTDQRW